jgi:hypothetical protein
VLQTALERTHRPAEPSRRLVARSALKIAQNQWLPQSLRQSGQLLMQKHLRFTQTDLIEYIWGIASDRRLIIFNDPADTARAFLCRSVAHRQTPGHAMEPSGHGGFVAQRMRPANECQEGGLKDILGVLPMMQQMQGQMQDHWPMPAHQFSESIVVALLRERPKQVSIRCTTAALVGEKAVNGSKQRMRRVGVHKRILKATKGDSTHLSVAPRRMRLIFYIQP